MSTPYDWLSEFAGLEDHMFVGFVHGVDPSGLLVSMGAGTVTGEMTFDELKQQPSPRLREVPPDATRLGATRLGDWTVLWSDNAVANQLIDALVKAAPERAMVIVASSYSISSWFLYRRDGVVQLAFDPDNRTAATGQDAESFVPLMASAGVPLIPGDRATGLPPDSDADDPGDPIRGSLTLADQITGTHLTAEVLRGACTWGLFTRDDFPPAKPVSTHPLRDTEDIKSALEAATPTARSRAVMFALQHIAEDAQVTGDPVVTRALEAVRQGRTEPPADLAPVLQVWRREARSAPKRWEVGPNDTEKIAQMRRGMYRNRLAEALEAAYGTDPAHAAAAVISHIRHDVTACPQLLDILKR